MELILICLQDLEYFILDSCLVNENCVFMALLKLSFADSFVRKIGSDWRIFRNVIVYVLITGLPMLSL